eukprot:1145668-Pelagomonas_calceolata.AAC.6
MLRLAGSHGGLPEAYSAFRLKPPLSASIPQLGTRPCKGVWAQLQLHRGHFSCLFAPDACQKQLFPLHRGYLHLSPSSEVKGGGFPPSNQC